MLLGALVTLSILLLGTRELQTRARQAATLHSRVLGEALAARMLESKPGRARAAILDRALSEGNSAGLLLDSEGRVIARAPGGSRDALLPSPLLDQGALRWGQEEARYSVVPLVETKATNKSKSPAKSPSERLVVMTKVDSTPLRQTSLVTSVLSFAALLLGAAGFVAWALARDVHADVLYLRALIVSMAKEATPGTRPIPVRTIDQVGQLTASFNTLLERFRAAERAYRQDLTEANAYDKDRSAFLAALSHELRTPLNAILGFTDVLLSGVDGPLSEDARENLTVVRTSGEHLRSLIDDILALSALESGQFRLSREELDVVSVAQDVVTEARVTADSKGIYLDLVELSGSPLSAYVDRRRVRQILQNLISNAVKFTSQGGVVVTVGRERDDVVITISDTGPGIESAALDGIWTEFSQVGTGVTQRQGTGLGLSITRRLVQMHGGTVDVESTVGHGSTFTITLPLDARRRSSVDGMIENFTDPIIREV